MTFQEFLNLSKEEQHQLLEKKISKLSFKRKDPIIDVIGLLRLLVDDSHNNTAWNVYKFSYTLEELTAKLNRLNKKRKGDKID